MNRSLSVMSSRSFGYSNAAYCNMYDNEMDDQDNFFLYQCNNETFVDDMCGYECGGGGREQPLGASGSFRLAESRTSTPNSTPRKSQHNRRQRSFSAPRNVPASTTMSVLAPMVAQARCPTIRRSRSAVFAKETEDRRTSLYEVSPRGHPSRRTISVPQNPGYQVRPSHEPPPSASYYDLRRQNLAVIPPSSRPLLTPSPPTVNFSPSKGTKGSWAPTALPRPSSSANTLRFSGLFLLFTSTVNCLLCFYLLAQLGLQKGRHYYIDFAVISGFAMLVLGFAGLRMGRWESVINRNYLAGYMVLSMLDVLLCVVLGLLSSDWRPPEMPEIVEIASGAICGLSALMILLALCLCAASCCRSPPPDNRVSHNVPSFIV